MRLHHLTLRAFGPFAEEEEVDFDELCSAGLFLLSGPTGAGKTTVLDAVCFALYGTVPGVRGVKALKSQHAPEDTRPEVRLDFSVRGRRFVVRRSPEWTRPKRRGTGTTTENATATLLETTRGEEHLLSSRAQEVGHFIGELVGMQSTQFVQVAMLPQGGFQKFLRATSQDRHEVLQHLFRTDRFSRIEEWVHDHSRALRESSATGEGAVVRILDTIADRCGSALPEGLADGGLRASDGAHEASTWADARLEEVSALHRSALADHAAVSAASVEARARHEDASRVRELVQRRDTTRGLLDRLAADTTAVEEAAGRIAEDDRAARCLPLLRMLDEAVADRETAQAEAADAAGRLAQLPLRGLLGRELPQPVTGEHVAGVEDATRDAIVRLETLLPREAELQRQQGELLDLEAELATAGKQQAALELRAETVPAALAAAHERQGDLATRAGRRDVLAMELTQARTCLDAAQDAVACRARLEELRDSERAARDRAADARERVQDLTARRLAGVAAELAGRLEPGHACQVCGSTEHPVKAQPATDAVTEATQQAAETERETLRAAHTELSGQVVQTEERLQALLDASGGQGPEEAAATCDLLHQQLQQAEEAARDLEELTSTITALSEEESELRTALADLATRVSTGEQAVASRRTAIAALRSEIDGALGGEAALHEDGSRLRRRIDQLTSTRATLLDARQALHRREAAVVRAEDLTARAIEASRDHGFADLEGLRAAVLSEAERRRLTDLLESRAQQAARAEAVLAEPDVLALGDQPAPDTSTTARALADAEAHEGQAARRLHQAEETLAAVRRQHQRLGRALEDWAPQREEYLRADAMAKLVRGTGADNQLQMRLSAYVLATRLDQVVAAANERLAQMRDQRYLLQRTGRAARKGSQAGLGLEVLDQWTGDVRDPGTLSGGETFVVSLALALGLADVVTHEAGGTEIETLFVDEGFGTLDADTLDDVMDRLDELRAGGRAVGVVSHVSELRNRIPTQLHVEKTRAGSSIALRTLVG
jgi:exonuclease SbcC